MEFAIKIEGEEQGRWVLSVDPIGDRFLTTDDENTFLWVDMTECVLLKVSTPELPKPVVMVQPSPNPLAIPNLRIGQG